MSDKRFIASVESAKGFYNFRGICLSDVRRFEADLLRAHEQGWELIVSGALPTGAHWAHLRRWQKYQRKHPNDRRVGARRVLVGEGYGTAEKPEKRGSGEQRKIDRRPPMDDAARNSKPKTGGN